MSSVDDASSSGGWGAVTPLTEPKSPHARAAEGAAWVPEVGGWIGGVYRLERVLGRGGLGVVFEATDVGLGRRVALKVLRPDLTVHEDMRRQLVLEARRIAPLQHPRIVTVHSCGSHRGNPFIVMELVDGSDAARTLKDAGGFLPIERAVAIVVAAAEGLDALHERGLAHGDVKPSNILLGADGSIKLTDVGLARGPGKGSVVSGTPAYMAPETILDHEGPLSGASIDVYALAVTAYELLTGSLPFQSTESVGVMTAHLVSVASPPSDTRAVLPPALDAALLAGLAKDPAARPASARELALSVQRALSELLPGSRSTAPAEPLSVAPKPELRRILVADDDADMRQVLSLALAGGLPGCVVQCVGNGDDALEAAMRHPPDAMVLDLGMPGPPCTEVIQRVRAGRRGASIAIVVLTGSGSASDWRELQRAGADRCYLKPFELDELARALLRLVRKRRAIT